MMKGQAISSSQKFGWITVLYSAEGFPFGLLHEAIPIALRQAGVRLADIGLLSLVALPWTLKFLWAPVVDAFGSRKGWIITCQSLLVATLVVLAIVESDRMTPVMWIVLTAIALFSATQDIAIDAYSIELLETHEMGTANGIRIGAYRIAMILAGGVLVALSAVIGWTGVEWIAAGVMLGFVGIVRLAPPVRRLSKAPAGAALRVFQAAMQRFWHRPHVVAVLVFVVIFKLGDMALAPMTKPFLVDSGLRAEEIGLLSGTLGVAATMVGAGLGGVLTSRWGIFRALWVLGLFQAASNLVYAGAAFRSARELIWGATIFEAFSSGLGTAAFLAFLMSICDKAFAATQYAVLSALFGLGRAAAGVLSGYAAAQYGYGPYFLLTFFLALPAFSLLPLVRKWISMG